MISVLSEVICASASRAETLAALEPAKIFLTTPASIFKRKIINKKEKKDCAEIVFS